METDVGRWLGKQRTEAGLTQKAVAAKCRLSDPYVTRLEVGSIEHPPLKTCRALARALGIQWEEVWRRAFAARLDRWLGREGFSHLSSQALVEISKSIDQANRQGR